MHVCGVRPCVVVVRDSVIGHAPVNLPADSSYIYCPEQVLCGVCIWGVMCGGHSEAVQDVHGLRVASVVLVWGLWGEAEYQAACWVRHCRVFFGCIRCGCGCEGICCRGVEGENPVLFGRVGRLFCVGVELAVCAPELIGGGVVGD